MHGSIACSARLVPLPVQSFVPEFSCQGMPDCRFSLDESTRELRPYISLSQYSREPKHSCLQTCAFGWFSAVRCEQVLFKYRFNAGHFFAATEDSI